MAVPKEMEELLKTVNEFNIPINKDKSELGKIIIKIDEVGELKNTEDIVFLTQVASLIFASKFYLVREIDLIKKVREEIGYKSNIHPFAFIYLPFNEAMKLIWESTISDKDIFNLVRSDGPFILRIADVLLRLEDWMAEEGSNAKLEELMKALNSYSKKVKSVKKPKKKGAPPNPIIRKYGSEWLKEFYDDLRTALNKVRNSDDPRKRFKHAELISESFYNVISSKKDELKKRRGNRLQLHDQKILEKNTGIEHLRSSFKGVFRDNKKIRLMYKGLWEANSLAKMIISSMIGLEKRRFSEYIRKK